MTTISTIATKLRPRQGPKPLHPSAENVQAFGNKNASTTSASANHATQFAARIGQTRVATAAHVPRKKPHSPQSKGRENTRGDKDAECNCKRGGFVDPQRRHSGHQNHHDGGNCLSSRNTGEVTEHNEETRHNDCGHHNRHRTVTFLYLLNTLGQQDYRKDDARLPGEQHHRPCHLARRHRTRSISNQIPNTVQNSAKVTPLATKTAAAGDKSSKPVTTIKPEITNMQKGTPNIKRSTSLKISHAFRPAEPEHALQCQRHFPDHRTCTLARSRHHSRLGMPPNTNSRRTNQPSRP